MIDDRIIERIQKLLALAADPANEHEAGLAAARAQDLLHRHNLDLAQVEAHTGRKAEAVGRNPEHRKVKSGSGTQWRIDLADAVARYGYCRLLFHVWRQNLTLYWVGRPTDAAAAKASFAYLERELDRLAQEYSTARWQHAREAAKEWPSFHEYEKHLRQLGMHPLRARRSWLQGAVAGVNAALYEEWAKRREDEAGHALMVVRDGELDEYVQRAFGKLTKDRTRRAAIDTAAFKHGYNTGLTMDRSAKPRMEVLA